MLRVKDTEEKTQRPKLTGFQVRSGYPTSDGRWVWQYDSGWIDTTKDN